MERSRGFRSKTRHKLRKKVRMKGDLPVSRAIQEFKPGNRVSVVIEPSVQKGQPHPRFHGKTGVVVEKRGRAYLVELKDGNATKKVIARPVHLVLQG